jgi:hypothetical protein
MTNEEKINLIGQKIFILSNDLEKYKAELEQLKQQLLILQPQQNKVTPPAPPEKTIIKQPDPVIIPEKIIIENPIVAETVQQQFIPPVQQKIKNTSTFNFEEFIGGKLISIIGIVVLVIGLGIGVKYAIDRDLINPLTRIILAYLAGGILLAIALRLKKNYKTFSAILLSGGMASLYFTTFAAYSMYALFPQMAAFVIMLIFTAFTVFAATVYELEVIGIIGLVGAYAVPMLLSDGSGKIRIMFTYMLIINSGILILSFKKYWQILNHFAFGLTWLIVFSWIAGKFDYNIHTPMVMIFSFLFFLIFYISNMSYKILKLEKFNINDIVRLLLNSFIFFGIGYGILNNQIYKDYLGLFTLANAIIHLIFSYIVFKNKLLDRKLFYLLIAMVLTFITIAVPVQLEGNWVTLFWCAEAALLFITGRYKNIRFYEWIGAIMISLSMFSLFDDWQDSYYRADYYNELFKFWRPILNIHFFSSLFFIAALGSIVFVNRKKAIREEQNQVYKPGFIYNYIFPALLFLFVYLTFSNELNTFFKAKFQQSYLQVPSKTEWAEAGAFNEIYDYSYLRLRDIANLIYAFVFFSICTLLTIKKWNSGLIRWTILSFNFLIPVIFLLNLHLFSELRYEYLNGTSTEYYPAENWYLYIRYLGFAFLGLLLFLIHKLLNTETFSGSKLPASYRGCIVHIFILVILSNELININILSNAGLNESYYQGTKSAYKLGFTTLWGIYSFILIAWGIFKRNRIMRITAISLFGITLVKLVTFDTWDLSTGYKIVAYILLGVILLVVAFLYQKFKVLIFGNDGEDKGSVN